MSEAKIVPARRSRAIWGLRAGVRALEEEPHRLLWAVWVRWLVIAGFLLLAVVAHAAGLFASIAPCLYVAGLGSTLNGVNEWCVRRRRHVFLVTAVQIPLDQLFITYLVTQTGGIHSPFLMLYAVQVLATAMLVDTTVAAASALLAICLWMITVRMQTMGYVQVPPLFAAGGQSSTVYQATWGAFLFYCLALLVYLGGYISGRLRASEDDLAAEHRRLQATLGSLEIAHHDLQAAYERLRLAEAHLVQSEKMRSLGELVAGVAHELNNPISFVSGNVEHMRAYVERLQRLLAAYAGVPIAPEERARLDALSRELRVDEVLDDLPSMLDDCEEGARRTKSIVDQLRIFSRSDAQEIWQVADLHHGIDSTLGLLAHRLKDHIAVHRDFGALPEIDCLPGQLNQVFMNLLANAVDAIGDGPGNIWVRTRVLEAGTPPAEAEPLVTVAIRDDGCGMSPDIRAKAVEPFFTTKGVGQGTGLGLSVSFGIVQRHRGTLAVESALGRGTTVTVTLPVRQPRGTQPVQKL